MCINFFYGRFACAVWSQNPENFAVTDIKAYIVYRRKIAKAPGQGFIVNHRAFFASLRQGGMYF